MRKLKIAAPIALTVLVLAGCMTVLSSIYDVSPNRRVYNPDGSETLEFLFPLEHYDADMAAQWVRGYLDNMVNTSEAEHDARGIPYSGMGDFESALTGYDLLNVSCQLVERRYGGHADLVKFGVVAAGYSPDYFPANTKNMYVSILAQVKYKRGRE